MLPLASYDESTSSVTATCAAYQLSFGLSHTPPAPGAPIINVNDIFHFRALSLGTTFTMSPPIVINGSMIRARNLTRIVLP